MINDLIGGDTDTIHKSSYEPITGKYNLYEAADKRYTYTDTYFEIDGSKSNFSLKYYENGKLKREGAIQRLVTYTDSIGKWCNNLHFNVKVGNESEHISTYTESFDPINQFRIIEEYDQKENKYYLSEMPYVMGTYVRDGASYKEEAPNTNEKNLIIPTLENFTSALNGFYKLDDLFNILGCILGLQPYSHYIVIKIIITVIPHRPFCILIYAVRKQISYIKIRIVHFFRIKSYEYCLHDRSSYC